MFRFLLPLLLYILLQILLPTGSFATLNISIDKGNIKPTTFAINHFSNEINTTFSIENVVANDLVHSGFFRFIRYADEGVNTIPSFAEYKNIGTTLLVLGSTTKLSNGNLRVVVRIWDTVMGKQTFHKSFTTKIKNWRRIGHIISDEIYQKVTGYSGYFDSKIVYVSETGSFFNKKKRLAIMDQDGANNIYLTNGTSLALMPVVSPSGNSILYVSYASKVPQVYILDVRTKQSQPLGEFAGMTSAPRYNPKNDDIIALSISSGGDSDIFKLDLRNKKQKRLTSRNGINTSPTFSPDGHKMAFVSDRSGSPQIYVMNSDGSSQQRISYGYGRYSNPSWSPTGEYIAFTKMEEREFFIGIMDPTGKDERLIAKGYLVEAPSWAPNGRLIIFTKEKPLNGGTKTSHLYTVDITGRNERLIHTPTDASDPGWSALLQ